MPGEVYYHQPMGLVLQFKPSLLEANLAEENKSFFLNYKFVAGFVLGGLFIQLLVLLASFILTEIDPSLLDNLLFNDAVGRKKTISDGIYKSCERIPNTDNFTTPYLSGISHALEKSIGNLEEIEKVTVSIWLKAGNEGEEKTPQGSVIIKFAQKSEDTNQKLVRAIKDYVCRYVIRLKKENLKLSELKDNTELELLTE